MRYFKLLALVITTALSISDATAQNNWISYSRYVDVKDYQGLNFRFTSLIKAETTDAAATAQLWARVDKQNGRGFFDNMDRTPVTEKVWNTYTIEGRIDSGAYRIAFGALCRFNGKFYYDDMKIEVETSKGTWKNIFTENFENHADTTSPGAPKWRFDANKYFSITTVEDGNRGKSLLIEGKDVPSYGANAVRDFANVNGIKLYYEIYGDGPPLVILHGNGGSVKSASAFYPDLVKQYKVIAIDSRAQGRSTTTGAPLTYDIMASDVNALLEQLHIDSVFIWGQSDGAILALLLAKDYPKKVKKALAYAPNIQADSLALFPWMIKTMKKTVAQTTDPKEKLLNQLMLDYPNIPYEDLAKIKAPILIMSGDRDVIRPEHILKMYQHIPNSQLCILPGSTHGGSWENKDLFLQLMNNFFQKPFRMPDTRTRFER
jgi:pimeloyl-ACP methyl ester carboxylesterase